MILKKFSPAALSDVELGERATDGLFLENEGPLLGSFLTIGHRCYVARLHAMGYTQGQTQSGAVAILPIP